MIFLENPGTFGRRTDCAFATGANAFAAADALISDTDGLLIFDTDNLGGADWQTRTTADTSLIVKPNKAG